MNAPAVNKKRVGRQHPDFNQRPDSGVIWLDELVKDAKHPDRIPLLPFSAATLWRTIAEGTFPKPVCKRGWRVGDVREWMRAWNALELPPTDSAQSTGKLFSAAPHSTRGTSIGSVRRVPAHTESDGRRRVGEPCDVGQLLNSIFEGATA